MRAHTPAGDGWQQIADRLADIERQLRNLQIPDATQKGSLVAQVQRTLANIVAQVNSIATAWMAANAYTKAQVDAKVANPGDIAPGNVTPGGNVTAVGNVTAGGQVTSAQPLKSLGSYNYQVTTNYKSGWINQDGQIGFSPSTLATKKDLEAFPDELAAAFLSLTPYLGRYVWDDDDDALKVFLIAEDTHAAGFGPDVVPLDEDGRPEAINYSQLVVPLLAVMQRQQRQIDEMQAAVEALTV